jgi:hypothetical protein
MEQKAITFSYFVPQNVPERRKIKKLFLLSRSFDWQSI